MHMGRAGDEHIYQYGTVCIDRNGLRRNVEDDAHHQPAARATMQREIERKE